MPALFLDGRLIRTSCDELVAGAPCGAPAPYGVGVRLLKDKPGRWYCRAHWQARQMADLPRSQGGDRAETPNDRSRMHPQW